VTGGPAEPRRPLRLLLTLFVVALTAVACSSGGEPLRVVFITLDTTRADRLGCYGYDEAQTPHLDALAAEGALFEQAVSSIPTTLPSHSTMFTGKYPIDHGVRYNIVFRLGADATTLAEVLSDAGFATAAFPASFILASRFGLSQGFQTWSEPPKSDLAHAGSPGTSLRPADEGVDLAIDWLQQQGDRKTFLWLHFYDPHAPYTPPFPYASRFRDRPYDGEIAYVDEQFGRLLSYLRSTPEWERTLVVVVGDHGEGLHEHSERFHSSLVYETTQHVPLIVRAPGAVATRVAEPVGLVDLMPTVLDLVGLDAPSGLRGISLAPALRGRQPARRALYFESVAGALNYGWDELRGVRRGRFKLIDSKEPELFDLERDPDEQTNLAALDSEQARLQDLRNALAQLDQEAGGASAEAALEAVLDPATEALLASLGYTGGGADGSSAADAPQPRDLIDMEGELLAAQAASGARDWPVVEKLAEYILSRDPTNRWALHNSASALIALGRLKEAQDRAAEQVRHYPDAERSHSMFARTYEAQGQHDTAYEVLRSALENEKLADSELLEYFRLVTAFSAEHDDVCTVEVPEVVRRFPESPKLLVLQARCFVRDGDIDTALELLAHAVQRGFRNLELLQTAEDFEGVAEHPGFQDLLKIHRELAQRAPTG